VIWEKEETWRSLRESYILMKNLHFRTQFIQAAYSECWVASKLSKAGYNVKFHDGDCDVSVVSSNPEDKEKKIGFEIKHSEDNKDPDSDGHGYASWVISRPQVKEEKFHICILLRDSLKTNEPYPPFILKREEIAKTEPVDVNEGRLDYYLWYSDHFENIMKKSDWMRKAANPLVKSLNKDPTEFIKRWNEVLNGKVQSLFSNTN